MHKPFSAILIGSVLGFAMVAPTQALMNERAIERCKVKEAAGTHQLVSYSEDAFVGTAFACIDRRYL